jgi:hypothetical protein
MKGTNVLIISFPWDLKVVGGGLVWDTKVESSSSSHTSWVFLKTVIPFNLVAFLAGTLSQCFNIWRGGMRDLFCEAILDR